VWLSVRRKVQILHMVQLMPLRSTVFCFSKIQIAFTCLVPAQPSRPERRAVKGCCLNTVLLALTEMQTGNEISLEPYGWGTYGCHLVNMIKQSMQAEATITTDTCDYKYVLFCLFIEVCSSHFHYNCCG